MNSPIITDLNIFVTIAEEENITKAAKKLFISQPALSYKLHQIEKNFDEPLFIRTTKGVILTELGELYYDYAKDMIKCTEKFSERIENKKSTISGTLRLGTSSIFANYKLPSILLGFMNLYPLVKLHIETGISSKISQLFINGDIHIGIIRGNHCPKGNCIHLYNDPICLVTAKDCKKENLTKRPLIRYATDSSLYTLIDDWWGENYNVPMKQGIMVDSMATCRQFVKINLGWSVLPYTGISNFTDMVNIEPLFWKNQLPIIRKTNLFYHDEAIDRKAAKAFIDYISSYPLSNILDIKK